jgi:hypothetical protein
MLLPQSFDFGREYFVEFLEMSDIIFSLRCVGELLRQSVAINFTGTGFPMVTRPVIQIGSEWAATTVASY